jgi:hypothetical protein
MAARGCPPLAVRSTSVPRRTLTAAAVGWVLTLVAVFVVAQPERCPTVTRDEARAASIETVQWFERNQLGDGRWTYAYDRGEGEADRSPHLVRHAGVTMSLYQAHAAGIDGALELADRGTAWALDQGTDAGGGTVLALGGRAPTGGAALLTAGLAIRKEATGDDRYDEDMAALGRFLVATIEPSGAVLAEWDLQADAPVPDLYSLFFTGEALWALVLLDRVNPEGGWREHVQRVARYVATERDAAEEWFPPVSDHWAAYALGDLGLDLLAEGDRLEQPEIDLARRLAGIFGIQIRYESQRTGEGLNLLLRGHQALGSGVGTLGEGLAPLWELAGEEDRLADLRPVIGERLRCVAGVLADRQVTEAEAALTPDPDLAQGAWFTGDRTQKDDQQHALSALLLAEPALAEAEAEDPARVTGAGDRDLDALGWLLVVLLAAANPVRARRVLGGLGDRAVLGASAALGAVLVVAAVLGPLVADVLRVSPPTLVLAAAIVVIGTGALDLGRRRPVPLGEVRSDGAAVGAGFVSVARPGLVLTVLAAGAHLGPVVGALLGVLAAGVMALTTSGRVGVLPGERRVEGALGRAVGALALAGGLTLVVTGTLSP